MASVASIVTAHAIAGPPQHRNESLHTIRLYPSPCRDSGTHGMGSRCCVGSQQPPSLPQRSLSSVEDGSLECSFAPISTTVSMSPLVLASGLPVGPQQPVRVLRELPPDDHVGLSRVDAVRHCIHETRPSIPTSDVCTLPPDSISPGACPGEGGYCGSWYRCRVRGDGSG
jgi:hypothetical protein